MTSGIETVQVVDRWLYETLSGDSELAGMVGGRIVGTLSQGAVATPYVVYFLSSSRDVYTVPTIRVDTDSRYTVKAVGTGATWSQVARIAAHLDALLHGAQATTSYGTVACVRDTVIQYAEVDGGTQYRHLGAVFRVRANAT